MSYEIVYAPSALDCLLALDRADLVDCFEQNMNRLASDPPRHSKPSRVPFPRGQAFDFSCPLGAGRRQHFRVHFFYRQNEQELLVFDVRTEDYLCL
jgi:mRNA-degrading endonuclease RelE of RelBE toxin-antitoxin system